MPSYSMHLLPHLPFPDDSWCWYHNLSSVLTIFITSNSTISTCKYTCLSLMWCITVNWKSFNALWQCKYWCWNQSLLQLLKALFTFLHPHKWLFLSSQFCQRHFYLWEVFDKFSIIPRNPQETSDFKNSLALRPIHNCPDLLGINWDPSLLIMFTKFTFLEFGIKILVFQ